MATRITLTELKQIVKRIVKEAVGNVEYVIWGLPPNTTPKYKGDEDLLVTQYKGEKITDLKIAQQLKHKLETEHGCTNVRIQKVDTSDNDISAFKNPF